MSSSSNLQESCRGGQLDVSTLAKLVSILGGPKDNTVRAGKREYSDRLSKGLQLDHQSKRSVEKTVHWLESARLALDGISQFIVEEIASLQDVLPCANMRYAGLEDLPDEVLLMIMERTVLLNWPPIPGNRWDGAVTLSHVCRRFRALALNSPTLWTHLTSKETISKNRVFLERSREHELDIYLYEFDLDEHHGQTRLEDFLGAVLEHCHRWKSFEVELVGYDDKIVKFLSSVTSICGHQDLPLLRTLVMGSTFHCGDPDSLDDEDGIHFYANWTLPMLEDVVLYNFVPRLAPMFSRPLQALDFSYSYTGNESGNPLDIRNLLGMLRTQPLLQSLKIGVYPLELFPSEDPVELHNLSSLGLNVFGFDWKSQAIASLMASLSLPNVTTLDAYIEIVEWGDVEEFLHSVFSGPNSFSKIETLNFSVTCMGSEGEVSCGFEKVLTLPSLSHLSINTRGQAKQDLWTLSEESISPLQSLQFSGCDNCYAQNLKELLRCLKKHHNLDKFRRLEVVECPSFRKRDAEKFLPQSKIVWKD